METRRQITRYASSIILLIINRDLSLNSNDLNEIDILDTRDIVDGSSEACAIAVEILNNFLSYEKLDAGLMILDKSTFAVWAFIEKTIKPFFIQVCIVCIFELLISNFT